MMAFKWDLNLAVGIFPWIEIWQLVFSLFQKCVVVMDNPVEMY
jgi:hypothetical protein